MKYNILIGGAAGQGMNTITKLLSKALKRHGYYVFVNTVYMSRIRGGHNYFQIRFSDQPLHTHENSIDVLFALNQETLDLHQRRLKENGIIIADEDLKFDPKEFALPIKKISKAIGNKKAENMILLGGLIKLFNLDYDIFTDLVSKSIKKDLSSNKEALKQGYDSLKPKFLFIGKQRDDNMLINGNTAIGLGAIAAGLGVFSAYPMTPAASIMNYLTHQQKKMGIIVEQAEDEIAAIHIALGASSAGVRAMTASSGGGLSLMVEALGLTAITETPLVITDVMRPGPATGLPTKTGQGDLSFLLTASQDELPRMIIAPRDPEDAYYQTIRAFDLADKYQLPVIVLSDQYLADSQKTIPLLNTKVEINQYLSKDQAVELPYERYKITPSGVSPRLIPGLSEYPIIADNHEHDGFGKISEDPVNRTNMHLKRLQKLRSLEADLQEPHYFGDENPDIVLIGFGSTEGALIETIETYSGQKKIGALVFGDVYPLPTQKLIKYKDKILINVELNATGQFSRLIRMETGIHCTESILKFDGLQINAEDILEVLHEKF
ncbi:MAG: 2-oxoacid:acceptor oxidoreductase subunit alpha [Clostridia bacterium]|nr:2-oxoacid:acceptor oxidoreductase subunit alpha [Clostridia bacterium]